jgi:hypothetical protein
MSDILQRVMNSHRSIQTTYGGVRAELIGKRARIISDWNGQPYGRSKPSQEGKEAKIVQVEMDPSDDEPSVLLEGYNLYIALGEIEIIP